jgi:4-hydroxy-tetrahydrodipicolinate reductase
MQMQTMILGDGHLGRAIAAVAGERGERPSVLGRPAFGRHDQAALAGADLIVDASRGDAVRANVETALDAGVRRFVIATTDWASDRHLVDRALRESDASAVVSANFSLGVALFARLVGNAAELFGAVPGFDPFLVEWHRRAKIDRPSGTALDLARRLAAGHPRLTSTDELEIVSIRAGASPGMHLVGFDAAGETIELRLTARDRTAYATGVLAAADWLRRTPRAQGIHPFDPVVDELLGRDDVLAA